ETYTTPGARSSPCRRHTGRNVRTVADRGPSASTGRDEMRTMQSLWPTPPDGATGEMTDVDLERLYDYPSDLDRPWVQANFVSSADGAVTLADRSEGLSHPADKRIFGLGRDLADVVLVGAGTA